MQHTKAKKSVRERLVEKLAKSIVEKLGQTREFEEYQPLQKSEALRKAKFGAFQDKLAQNPPKTQPAIRSSVAKLLQDFDPDASALQYKPRRTYTNNPNLTLGPEHMAPGWENHHPDLVNGLKSDTGVRGDDDATITPGVRVAEHADKSHKVLVKPELSQREYLQISDELHTHFLDPNFTSAHREGAYHKLADQFFGLGQFVPRTTVFKHPNGEFHSAQEFIPHTTPYYSKAFAIIDSEHGDQNKALQEYHERYTGKSNIQKLAIMNNILGNNDRHAGNALVDRDNKLHLIDHGLAFDYGEIGNSPFPVYAQPFAQSGIEKETHLWLQNLDENKLAHQMSSTGAPPILIASAVNRLQEIKNWSKRALKKYLTGIAPNPGLLHQALAIGSTHTLVNGKDMRPKKAVDQDVQALENPTLKYT